MELRAIQPTTTLSRHCFAQSALYARPQERKASYSVAHGSLSLPVPPGTRQVWAGAAAVERDASFRTSPMTERKLLAEIRRSKVSDDVLSAAHRHSHLLDQINTSACYSLLSKVHFIFSCDGCPALSRSDSRAAMLFVMLEFRKCRL